MGYVLFLGLLVAILTQWMNAWIHRVEAGLSELRFNDHILILGWNHRTPSIVLELLRTKGRVSRFLKKHEADTLRIVILAEAVDVGAAMLLGKPGIPVCLTGERQLAQDGSGEGIEFVCEAELGQGLLGPALEEQQYTVPVARCGVPGTAIEGSLI